MVTLRNDREVLDVTVVDDGVGLSEGFSLEAATGLGLTIVRTLVTTELAGTIDLHRGDGAGERPGTIVELHVPMVRSEEHTSELQSIMRTSYAVFCLKKK